MTLAGMALSHTIALRASATGHSADLRREFGSGLGVYGRGSSNTDLCTVCEPDPSETTAMPFPILRWLGAFTRTEHEALLEWLTQRERWLTTDGGFYCADVFGLSDDAEVPQTLASKLGDSSWAEALAANAFGERLQLHGPIALHRMRPGHGIGIHSDRPEPGEETHRIVITICASLPNCAGGHFVLLDGTGAATARVLLPLQSNAALAFRLEPNSYHAITTMRNGIRFSIVMSFRSV